MQQPLNLPNLLFSFVIIIAFSACTTLDDSQIPAAKSLLYDRGFSGFKKVPIETEQQIFYLGDDAKVFVKSIIEGKDRKTDQMGALVHAIFARSDLNLLYQGDANTNANDTFHARAANCLSMSIMTYALAEEAGFKVDFQEIMIPEYWTRQDGFSLINGHINLTLIAPTYPDVFELNPRTYQVDFDPQSTRRGLPKRIVDKKTVLAMFYNNKGADAFLNKDFKTAYAYFRAAVLIKPRFQSAWINLGILYRLNNYYVQAENAYQHALLLNPDSLTALENLAHLYNYTDREAQAQEILDEVANRRTNNPFYHVNLGQQKIEQKHWDEALAHFRKALALDRSKHQVYFGLARVYFEIGELQKSHRYLKLAKHKTNNRQDAERYQHKIAFLNSL
jgi:tetratricopeptide (TPR) repeat protein